MDSSKDQLPETSIGRASASIATRLVLVLLAAILCLPLGWGLLYTDTEQRALFEKRELAELPVENLLANPKQYFSELERFLDDHIAFAVEINQFYSTTKFNRFNESPVQNISIGKDGFIFLNAHNSKRYNKIFSSLCKPRSTEPVQEIYFAKMAKVAEVVSSFGHRPIFATPITKPSLYPDKLPRDISLATRADCQQFLTGNSILKDLNNRANAEGILSHYPFEEFIDARDEPRFYPKENFHWNGKSPHLFSKTLFEKLGVEIGPDFDRGAYLELSKADLKSLGFTRQIAVWKYPYEAFELSANNRAGFIEIKDYYARANDYSYYTSGAPLLDRDAIVISNSFGAYTKRHLAVGYRSLRHININHLQADEIERFYRYIFSLGEDMDIIFLFHDEKMANGETLGKLERTIGQLPLNLASSL